MEFIMNGKILRMIFVPILMAFSPHAVSGPAQISSDSGQVVRSSFTGEQETVFYVTDVRRSVEFYKALGFEFREYWDYDEGKSVRDWTKSTPPQWALMAAGSTVFGLTTPDDDSGRLLVGGARHYFIVDDVNKHYEWVKEQGVDVDVLEVRPWMNFFDVTDPDGHTIVIGTRNPD